jgi:hypothetical protein
MIDLGVVASIDGDALAKLDRIHVGPGELLRQADQIGRGRAPPELEREDPLSAMAYEGGPAHAGISQGDALRAEGIKAAARVIDPRGTPAE